MSGSHLINLHKTPSPIIIYRKETDNETNRQLLENARSGFNPSKSRKHQTKFKLGMRKMSWSYPVKRSRIILGITCSPILRWGLQMHNVTGHVHTVIPSGLLATKNNTALSQCVKETLWEVVCVLFLRIGPGWKKSHRRGTDLECSLEKHLVIVRTLVIVRKKNNILSTSEPNTWGR